MEKMGTHTHTCVAMQMYICVHITHTHVCVCVCVYSALKSIMKKKKPGKLRSLRVTAREEKGNLFQIA